MNEALIHPTAVIDHPVVIGEGTKIWHFCHICSGATIGQDCVLGQNGYVASTVVVGDRCRIQNNVSLYDGVILEADVFVGPSVVFTNVTNPRAMINRHAEYRATRICRGCTVGANATILPGVTLGSFCFVGAGAVVVRDVPPHALVIGVPATPAGWVSRAGQRLQFSNGTDEALCSSTGERYRLTSSGPEICSEG
jgi:UDP-2-acetamido-3-amino-2,3-dideoxy-glucuronate N-acetyltransferase